MAHISLPDGLPGIVSAMEAYPESGKILGQLAQHLLARESATLSKADRELIAAFVSFRNACVFCSESHAEVANVHAGIPGLSQLTWEDPAKAPMSDRLKALFTIAQKVQTDARTVSGEDVALALKLGATEHDVHDTVLIAAAFCMFNRYVDGLATLTPPRGDQSYKEAGRRLATKGYVR